MIAPFEFGAIGGLTGFLQPKVGVPGSLDLAPHRGDRPIPDFAKSDKAPTLLLLLAAPPLAASVSGETAGWLRMERRKGPGWA